MKKKFAIKKVHIKGGVLGGGIGAILASLFIFSGPLLFSIAIGGFVAIYVVRKEIKLSYLEGIKIGLISAIIPTVYMFFILERSVKYVRDYILEHGVEAYMMDHNATLIDPQTFEDAILNHPHTGPIQWTLTVFIIMLTGTWIALIFYKPRTKKMH
jgi:hypothetical protein